MIPPHLKINGRKWKVRFDFIEDNGECDYEARTITISEKLDKQDAEETFLHEVLHALIPEASVWDETTEELVVSLMAPRLLATLKGLGAWK